MKDKTLVLGASTNPGRYSFLAMKSLLNKGRKVLAVGKTGGNVDGIEISTQPIATDDVDTITLYLNPAHQQAYYDYMISLKPRRIIFNPGTENEELEAMAEKAGIQSVEACTLVMLSTGQY